MNMIKIVILFILLLTYNISCVNRVSGKGHKIVRSGINEDVLDERIDNQKVKPSSISETQLHKQDIHDDDIIAVQSISGDTIAHNVPSLSEKESELLDQRSFRFLGDSSISSNEHGIGEVAYENSKSFDSDLKHRIPNILHRESFDQILDYILKTLLRERKYTNLKKALVFKIH